MPYRGLRDFMEDLEARGQLIELDESLSLDLELPAVLRRVTYAGGPAVLFKSIKEGTLPAVGNLFGSWNRVSLALGDDDPYGRVASSLGALTARPPSGLLDAVRSLGELSQVTKVAPKVVRSGPVRDVGWEKVDLGRLPAIRQWPGEPGRFFTMAVTFVKGNDGSLNFGYYRLQVIGEDRLIMHWMPWRRGAAYGEAGRGVAIVFGPDPITMLMAGVPVPRPLDKSLVTGIVRGEGMELVRGDAVDVEYPAHSELVIEGELTGETAMEGPFGDHAGVYSTSKPYPVVKVKAINSRRDPVLPVTVTGRPVLEDGNIIRFGERVALALTQQLLPEVVDLHMPPEGLGYVTIVSIAKRYPGHAKRIAAALWAFSPLYHKFVVVVDSDVDPRDRTSVEYAVAANVNPERDIYVMEGYPTEELDPSTPTPGFGSKACIDATRKLPDEYGGAEYPGDLVAPREIEEMAKRISDSIVKGFA
ncbi:MAG: UbiD family decarboxylase [Conexivisphaerales archaeon]|jgi:4-hydroxy-3-polyprenylbenzoate decarboxylase|nr:UbiD family decarboxylase [Conexivisphaerales archaeon]